MTDDTYQFKIFKNYKKLAHGISSEEFGSMKNVDILDVDREALNKFAKSISIENPVICMKQIHSGTVSLIGNNKALRIPDTDGLITDKKHIPLAVLTADCLPIMFYDPKKEVIGVAHAGYKGLLNHIIEHAIDRFVIDFKSDPEDILIGIGPSIERDCYEVSFDLIERFQKEFPSFDNIFVEKEGKFYLDLRTIAQQCLVKAGILKEHSEMMDICTKCDSQFYSHRGRDGEKRFASVISLV